MPAHLFKREHCLKYNFPCRYRIRNIYFLSTILHVLYEVPFFKVFQDILALCSFRTKTTCACKDHITFTKQRLFPTKCHKCRVELYLSVVLVRTLYRITCDKGRTSLRGKCQTSGFRLIYLTLLKHPIQVPLIHCDIITPYSDIDLGQHCLMAPIPYLDQYWFFISEVQ